tara:strand:+ start:983 stop:2017 length:1035 start_codon:yes stop_codon:yes gene_type:complete
MIAFYILAAVLIWILSGILGGNGKNEALEGKNMSKEINETVSVRVMETSSEKKVFYLTIRGKTEANKKINLNPKTSSNVIFTSKKGDFVKKNDLVCSLEEENRSAMLDEAFALQNQASLQYDAINKLKVDGYRSENDLAMAEAKLKSADAKVKMAQNELNNTKILSPFDGYIEEVYVEIGSLIGPSLPCVTIIQLDPMKVVGEVTEKEVGKIEIGSKVEIELLNNRVLKGLVKFVSKSASPLTRTYMVEAELSNISGEIREGLTAEIKVPIRETTAHLIPSYLLSLNDSGELGVKIAIDNKASFKNISIIEDTPEGLWVEGLPKITKIITVGQEYVIEGQEINY